MIRSDIKDLFGALYCYTCSRMPSHSANCTCSEGGATCTITTPRKYKWPIDIRLNAEHSSSIPHDHQALLLLMGYLYQCKANGSLSTLSLIAHLWSHFNNYKEAWRLCYLMWVHEDSSPCPRICIVFRVSPKVGYLGTAPPLQVTVAINKKVTFSWHIAGENVLSCNNVYWDKSCVLSWLVRSLGHSNYQFLVPCLKPSRSLLLFKTIAQVS